MAKYGVVRGKDYIYRRNQYDAAPAADVRQSIKDTRAAYSNMTDREFAKWYAKRYGAKEADVLAFIARGVVG